MRHSVSAASRLSSATRMRTPGGAARRRGRARGCAALRGGGAAAGARSNAAALARPVAARARPCRRAARRAAHQRQPDAQAALRLLRAAPDLRERARTAAREHLGRECRCRCRAPRSRPRRPRCSTRSSIAPPGGVYLAALLSRLESTCARRVGSASTTACAAGMRVTSRWPAASIAAGWSRAPRPPPRPSVDALPAQQRACRCVMRAMSSRSSTRRAMCATWRSITSRLQARSGSAAPSRPRMRDAVADRRQRVAQLVRQRGEELVLAPVGLAQRLLGCRCSVTSMVMEPT